MRLTIAENVAVRALAHPDRIAIEVLDGGATLTYGQVWCRITALAEALSAALSGAEAGRHGTMVALLLPNEADAVLAYLACQIAGVAAVPISTRLAEPEIRFVVEDADAKIILTGGPFAEVADKLGVNVIRVEDIKTPAAVPRPLLGEGGRGEAPCVVGYTSGTTGFPKGALYSNDHYLAALMRWGWEFGLTADQVMLVPGPLFHLSYAGLSMAALAIGARIRIMPEFKADLALAELTEHCSFAFLVPSMTTMVEEEWRRQGEPLVAAFRFMISSGAPGPLSMTRTAMQMFPNAKITEAYGWTEGGWVTFEVKQRDTLLAHSVGWPTFGNEVAVFNEAGEPCDVGQAGEVGVKSVTHFDGYLGREEATAAAWHRGYVMSGDIGIWQPDGRLCIVDRKKDMIISGGENIYTAEVERIVHEHPSVLEAAVVGLPDKRWGELVTALVVPREGMTVKGAELETFCRERLASFKVPRRIEVVNELPRNPMGKVQKFKIVEDLSK
ncbi:MAG: AMP-binding protein [Rhodospirillaceae bacterium]|jgi:acyl-CoA synthetase (AMP-forming)/AMP-acid ligase II|nr:AMP-binding protein [Rhodospirillaceae bacterium]MBT5079655.1 AMP-binding protein [Rhodospirillaceae bacterium]MBT5527154.1 AMP-binding protein [Rhodospirillaceae bacterium]MBT5882050.1 AMP-binding protein [Rhodospirillaceae bacterium]MBT7284347.1 AMP-binding protein [Rhodospirillaceae bacterium]